MNPRPPDEPKAAAPAPPSVLRVLRDFPRPVWVLLAGTFINRFGTFVVPFLTLHLLRLGYSPGEASLALLTYGAGHWAASAIGGHLADTFGRRKTIVLSMLLGAVCMLWLSQVHSLGGIAALAFLTGLVGEFYRPASSALLTDLVPESQRVTAFAAYRFAVNAGWAFGPATGGLLARYSYEWLFFGDALTSALFGLLAWRLLPAAESRELPGSPEPIRLTASVLRRLATSWQTVIQDRRFVRLALASLPIGLIFMQVFTTLGLQVKAAGYSEMTYGLVLGLNGLLIVAFEIPLSGLTRRPPPHWMMAAGFVLVGCGAGVFAWATSPAGFALGMTVLTAGEILSMPVAMAYVATLAPPAMRGRYLGAYGLTWATAMTCGPTAGALVFSWSPAALWIGCWLGGLLSAAIILRADRPQAAPALPSLVLPNPGPAQTTAEKMT